MAFQEIGNSHLIFFRCKGAGGVYQPATGTNQFGGIVENVSLTAGAHFHSFLAPVGNGSCLFAEHTLTGAGGIHQNPVKEIRKSLCQDFGIFVGDQGVGDCHTFHVPGQDFGAFRTPFIAQ